MRNKLKWLNLIGLLMSITVIWFGYMYIMHGKFNGWTSEGGWFGDSFGGLNALFSGLAFGGIIYTIFLQKQELKLQRKELKQTRNEFVVQNETLKKQRFESTFFHLIALHNQIVEALYITKTETYEENIEGTTVTRQVTGQRTYDKRDFFKKALNDLDTHNLNGEYEDKKEGLTAIIDAYQNFNIEYASHLNHYFRNLYHIYKYIHTSKLINYEEKKFYSQIIRAQLSDNELTLIFYNMLVPGLGFPNFKFIDQEYDVLKNLDFELCLFDISHLDIFSENYAEDPFS